LHPLARLLKGTDEEKGEAGEQLSRLPKSSFFSILSSPLFRLVKDIALFSLAFFGIFAVFSRIAVIHDHSSQDPALLGCNCGNSVAEAISRGCKFDSLATAWLPDHCRDDELTAEFQTAGDGRNGTWPYWADVDHKVELSLEQVAALADDPHGIVHTGPEYHKVHCIFYWRKQFRSRTKLKGKMIVEPMIDNEGHIKHCGKVILRTGGYGGSSRVLLNTNSHAQKSP
jgi:hypothetical protein